MLFRSQASFGKAFKVAAKLSPQEKVFYLIIFMIVVMIVLWFALIKNSFQGPPMGDEIKKRQAAIAAQEKALDAAS